MAALTPVNAIGARGKSTEYGGDYKLQILTVTPTTTTDTITLVRATDKVTTLLGVLAQIETGMASTFLAVQAAFSGLVITLTTKNEAGAAATTFGQIRLFVVGTS